MAKGRKRARPPSTSSQSDHQRRVLRNWQVYTGYDTVTQTLSGKIFTPSTPFCTSVRVRKTSVRSVKLVGSVTVPNGVGGPMGE